MAWMTVAQIDQKIGRLAGVKLSRYPKATPPVQPELFSLGSSTTSAKEGKTGVTVPLGAYLQTTSFDIKAFKIPSRVQGKKYQGALDQLSVLVVGGVLGIELIGPEATLHFAELFLDAEKGYTANDSNQGTTYNAAKDVVIYNYTLSHERLEAILNKLNIWILPLLNPGGRDVVIDSKGAVISLGSSDLGRLNPGGNMSQS